MLREGPAMRILMFGRGVISTHYGRALQAAGHDVEFYVRPGRAADYGDHVRLDVIDARRKRRDQHVRTTVSTRLRESLTSEDEFDLVIISVGHHHLAAACAFLAPRIGQATVLIFGNIWQEPRSAVSPLPPAQTVFGFPQGGGGFTSDGVLKGALLRSVVIGRSGASPTPRERAVSGAFRSAGFTIRHEQDMRGWLFIHFIADAGMFAEGARGGALAGMIGDRRAFRRALQTSRELLPVLTARRVDLRRHRVALLPLRLAGPVSAVMAFATKRVPIARLSLESHTDPDAAEARAILRDTLAEAERLGITAPRLAAAVQFTRG